jgi:hypothetical protein
MVTVYLKTCCGAAVGEWCDCATWAAEAAQVLAGQDPARPVITLPTPTREAAR